MTTLTIILAAGLKMGVNLVLPVAVLYPLADLALKRFEGD